jgi:ABC-type branched-subunit amino acid transport system substrate-binding protein
LHLQLKDDGWVAQVGKTDLDNFIQSQQYFALAVVPSSEGLNAASQAKDIDRAADSMTGSTGIPVVGTDGMLNSQYTDPWIWPVAASTATSMRIMAHHAIAAGAHDLAIVYDQNYRFGPEGAGAFVKQAQREGHNVPTACRIALTAGQQGYGTQAKSFNDNCKSTDFVALLLEPQTAQTWLRESPYLGTRADGTGKGFGGPQPLFDKQFGDNCGDTCKNMEIWTSMYPPIYPYDQQAAVRTFKQDLCAVDNDCNVHSLSAFTEGGYAGMELLVTALQKTSPYLTRERLKATLDSLILDDGINGVLTFKPGVHYANLTMVAFKDTYSGGSASFQYEDGSQQTDPCPSCQDPALNQ